MVEVLLESGGQEVAVAKNASRSGTPTDDISSKVLPESVEVLTPIQEFYNGQTIFITGGTGFVGKLLIEKLLRSCPGIASIYLLVRYKKGKDAHERVEEIFDDPVFSKLKEEQPKFRHRIVSVTGDCSLPNLGLSECDRETLIREVSIVFHVAATVRFDEKMKSAVAINVRSPRDAIRLFKEMRRQKAFVHVSTAYANCPFDLIEEKFYDPPMDPDKLISLVECMDEELITEITPRLLHSWPNTYTFTKAVAENVVLKEAGNLPIGIYRPAIVVSTYREPLQGWVDNMYGPTGVAAGAGTGLLRSLHCDGSLHANVIPGDMTVNALIASAWDIANIRSDQKEAGDIPIYNYVSKDNQITYDELKVKCEKYGIDVPSARAIWYYSFRNNKHRLVHLFYVYFLHLLPALLVDTAILCVGKQPRLLKIYKKIHKFMDVLNYFTIHDWDFTNDRVHAMMDKLSSEDQKTFDFDIRNINWDEYFKTYIKGVRIYLVKDPLDTLPQARAKWQRLYWIHQATKLLLAYACIRIGWAVVSTIFPLLGL